MPIPAAIDEGIFLFVNHLPHTMLTDAAASLLSGAESFGAVWLLLGFLLILRQERKNHRFIVRLSVVLFGAWALVDRLLKILYARPRPDPAMGAIIVGSGADGFSFPSSHAAVAWAAYMLLSRYEPSWRPAFFILALGISFSRIYLGVHYPADVLAGSLIGWAIGTVVLVSTGLSGRKMPVRSGTTR